MQVRNCGLLLLVNHFLVGPFLFVRSIQSSGSVFELGSLLDMLREGYGDGTLAREGSSSSFVAALIGPLSLSIWNK